MIRMSEFKENYFNTFGSIYRFMEKHHIPKTDSDWEAVYNDLSQFKTKFENDLALAILNELESRYKSSGHGGE